MKTSLIIKLVFVLFLAGFSNCGFFSSFKKVVNAVKTVVKTTTNIIRNYNNHSDSQDGQFCSVNGHGSTDCHASKDTSFLYISNLNGHLPSFFHNGSKAKIPLIHVQDVQRISDGRVGLIPKYEYLIRINRFGAVYEIRMYQITHDKNDNFVNSIRNHVRSSQNHVKHYGKIALDNANLYVSEKSSIANSAKEYDVAYVKNLNSKISIIQRNLNEKIKEKNNLVLQNIDERNKVQVKRGDADQKRAILDQCHSESDTINTTIRTYKQYLTDFSEDKQHELVAVEQSSLCKFNSSIDDLVLTNPSCKTDINRSRIELSRNKNDKEFKDLSMSECFYINNSE